MLVTFPVIRQ
ncbi:hypothetical protein YPPY71_0852, partial [Yersinia pestis PY-71]